jgi:hypothetical protein
MFRRSFFLLRLVDIEGVRVAECGGWGNKYPVSVGTGGRGTLEGGDVSEGEQMGKRTLRGVLQVQLEGIARQVYGGSDCMKDVFGGVLEFGGHGASHRIQIVKSGEARRNEVVDVQDGTGGSHRPWDMYARWGVVPSVGVVISIKGVVEFEGRGHCVLRSDMMETVQMWRTYYLNPWCSSPLEFVRLFGLNMECTERQDKE